MEKLRLAICDAGAHYRKKFAEYITKYKGEEIEVFTFSEEGVFAEKLEEIHFHIVVLGDAFKSWKTVLRERKIPVLLLLDRVESRIAEEIGFEGGGCSEEENDEGICSIDRYQSMDSILHRIYCMTEQECIPELLKRGGKTEYIGVCSPVRHEMQMLFSLVYASELAKEHRVLYLNFLEFSGFYEMCDIEDGLDVGDLILALRSNRIRREQIRDCIYEMGALSYISPFRNSENIHELTVQDFNALLKVIEEEYAFELVVIDFGSGMKKFSKMLEVCSKIYCLSREGYYYQCQINQFLEYIKATAQAKLREKIKVICLPFDAKRLHGGCNLLEQLNWSEFGDFVRRRI